MKVCPKCKYERTTQDELLYPDYECPSCGIILEKEKAKKALAAMEKVREEERKSKREKFKKEKEQKRREEEDRKRKEDEARQLQAEEASRKKAEEERAKREEEERLRQEEESRKRQREEARRKKEEEERIQREKEEQLRQEDEERRRREKKARQRQEDEALRKMLEEERIKGEEEERLRQEEERLQREKEEQLRKEQEEKLRKQEEERERKKEEEKKRKVEQERIKKEDEAKRLLQARQEKISNLVRKNADKIIVPEEDTDKYQLFDMCPFVIAQTGKGLAIAGIGEKKNKWQHLRCIQKYCRLWTLKIDGDGEVYARGCAMQFQGLTNEEIVKNFEIKNRQIIEDTYPLNEEIGDTETRE